MQRMERRYVPVFWREFVPVVAILWPVEKIAEFLPWAEIAHLPGDPNPRSDDAVIGFWMRKEKQQFLAAVPSLVQHNDAEPSVKRGPQERRPQDTSRPAAMLCDNAMDYDWSMRYAPDARGKHSKPR
jgi:hypothetical protein